MKNSLALTVSTGILNIVFLFILRNNSETGCYMSLSPNDHQWYLPTKPESWTDDLLTKSDFQSALDSQGAVNITGLAHSLIDVASKLAHAGSDAKARHPIIVLYLFQMSFLAHYPAEPQIDNYSECYMYITDRLKRFAEQEKTNKAIALSHACEYSMLYNDGNTCLNCGKGR